MVKRRTARLQNRGLQVRVLPPLLDRSGGWSSPTQARDTPLRASGRHHPCACSGSRVANRAVRSTPSRQQAWTRRRTALLQKTRGLRFDSFTQIEPDQWPWKIREEAKTRPIFFSFLALGTTNCTIGQTNLQGPDCVRRTLRARDLLAFSQSSSIADCFAPTRSENPVRLPRLAGRRQARRRRRAPPSQRRGGAGGSQSRPLAADGAAHRGASGDVEDDARLNLLRHRPRNGAVEAQVPVRLRHRAAPLVLRALLATSSSRQPRASGPGS